MSEEEKFSDFDKELAKLWGLSKLSEDADSFATKLNQGILLGNFGSAYRDLGRTREAIQYFQRALEISLEIGDRRHEGVWLGSLGNAYRELGEVQTSIQFLLKALEISRETGDRRHEGIWLRCLGNAYRDLGQTREAIQYYQEALVISREIEDRRNEGISLGGLADAYAAEEKQQLQESHQAQFVYALIKSLQILKSSINIDELIKIIFSSLDITLSDINQFANSRSISPSENSVIRLKFSYRHDSNNGFFLYELVDIIIPYVSAILSAQRIFDEIRGKRGEVIKIVGISTGSINVDITGGIRDTIDLILNHVVPWRRQAFKTLTIAETELAVAKTEQAKLDNEKSKLELIRLTFDILRDINPHQSDEERILIAMNLYEPVKVFATSALELISAEQIISADGSESETEGEEKE